VRKSAGYLGGSVSERLDDLHGMFADPEVKAIFAVRGGYGSGQLLDGIDFDLIRRNPKIFAGFSDITALHLAIHAKAGIVTFHGPVALSRFSDYTLDNFKRALFSTRPLGLLRNPVENRPLQITHPMRTLHPGQASGPLIGGNLSLISATLGTPFEIKTEGRILFIEDVGEEPYSMDRMLTHMRLAGKFKSIKGLIIGECADCRPRDYQPSFDSTFSVPEVLDNILGDLDVPMFSGLVIGHTEDQLTLPLGVNATLDADAGTLTLDEAALSE
jgi:muramoyltetrapeptide carboxypeptidase